MIEDKLADLKAENGELWRKLIQLEMSLSRLRQEVFELSGQEREYHIHGPAEAMDDDDWEDLISEVMGDALTDDERDAFG